MKHSLNSFDIVIFDHLVEKLLLAYEESIEFHFECIQIYVLMP